MTWEELREHMRTKYKLAIDAHEKLGLLWRIGTEPEIEEQRELVELLHVAKAPYVCITTDVVDEERLSPSEAIRHNATIGVGALALVGRTYVMRMTLPLSGLSVDTLDRVLELMSHEAARIRHQTKRSAAPIPRDD